MNLWRYVCPVVFMAALAVAVVVPAPARIIEFRFSTGPEGGAWAALGGVLDAVWERALPNARIKRQSGDPFGNINAIETMRVTIGLGTSVVTAAAIAGTPPFSRKHTNVCQVATLYLSALQVIAAASSALEMIGDLNGRVLALPPKGDPAEPLTDLVLAASGVTVDAKSVAVPGIDAVRLLEEGKVDALIWGGPAPLTLVASLAQRMDIRLLPIPADAIRQLQNRNRGIIGVVLPADTYPKHEQDVLTAAYAVQLLAPCGLPEQRGYGLAKSVGRNLGSLGESDKSFHGVQIEDLAEEFGTPVHPGARRFFQEPVPPPGLRR